MRGSKRNPWLYGLGVLLAILVVYGGHARADVTTDQSGSIVIFPKVIANGTRDTLIQITNTSNLPAQAHCFYIHVNSRGDCDARDFDIFLTAQQPTMWRASTGRFAPFPAVGSCKPSNPLCTCFEVNDPTTGLHSLECPGTDPNLSGVNTLAVAPTGADFVGELKCVQVSSEDDQPLDQNSLKGEAVIEDLKSGQVSEYNAISIAAIPGQNNRDNDLKLLNGTTSGTNEYNSCPQTLILNQFADGVTDDFTGASISTELTLVPCTEFPQLEATSVNLLVDVCNEFEVCTSAPNIKFDCTFTARLTDVPFQAGFQGSTFLMTRIRPTSSNLCATGDRRGLPCTHDDSTDLVNGCPNFRVSQNGTTLGCRPASGVVGVAEEFHSLASKPDADGTAAVNLFVDGTRPAPGDIIVLPPTGP